MEAHGRDLKFIQQTVIRANFNRVNYLENMLLSNQKYVLYSIHFPSIHNYKFIEFIQNANVLYRESLSVEVNIYHIISYLPYSSHTKSTHSKLGYVIRIYRFCVSMHINVCSVNVTSYTQEENMLNFQYGEINQMLNHTRSHQQRQLMLYLKSELRTRA